MSIRIALHLNQKHICDDYSAADLIWYIGRNYAQVLISDFKSSE
jgi:hypothetical protein